jgi:putative nucleic acid binding protein
MQAKTNRVLQMQRWKRLVLGIIVIIILSGFGYAYYIWNKPSRDVSTETGIKITSVALFDSFSNNEQAANTSFLNKAVEVTGKVNNVKTNQAGSTVVYLQSNDPVFGVNCTFKQYPGKISKGDDITFKGICTGYLSDVILNEGVLVK